MRSLLHVNRSVGAALAALTQAALANELSAEHWGSYTDEQRAVWAIWVARPWRASNREERLRTAIEFIGYQPGGRGLTMFPSDTGRGMPGIS
jgi:hypothetical protein